MTVFSWIRWKYFVPFVIFVTAIILFFVIFLDPLIARGIEKAGSAMNGAKVDVSGLKTKIFKGRLAIARLQVADPGVPMQNRIEMGPMAFQLELSPLISKRFIINEASLNGIAFNTPRKTSGAMPARKVEPATSGDEPSAAAKLAEKYKERFKLNIDGIKGDIKAKLDFDPKELTLVKTGEELKAKVEGLPKVWEDRVKGLNVDERLKNAEAQIKSIKETKTSGTEALTAIPEALKKLQAVKTDLDTLKKEVSDSKTAAVTDLKSVKTGIADLSQAKKKDVDNLMSRLNLDFANPDRLVEGLVGPVVLQRFQTAFRYIQLARKHMPSSKDKVEKIERPRAKGMDIEFPTPAAPPRFWWMTGALSGAYSGVTASGELSNLTTDPARIGLPFKLSLKGAQGSQTFGLQSTLDHTTDINKDSFIFNAAGFDVKDLISGSAENAGFAAGQGSAEAILSLIGNDSLGGQIKLALTGVKFDDATLLGKVGVQKGAALSGTDKMKADFMTSVARAIESMKEVAISAQVSGSLKDPNLKITSNLAPVIGNVLKNSIGNAAKEQRAQLEAKLDGILAEKQKELQSKVSGLDGKLGQFGDLETKVQQKISEASGINLGGGDSPVKIPSLKSIFKK